MIKGLLVVVDRNDKVLGYKTKTECHQGKGLLHRAFSIFVFNHQRELLLQKRSQKKLLWPGIWSNTCCSHPEKGEVIKKAAEKRLKEELGFSCPLRFLGKLRYEIDDQGRGSENEVTHIFVGQYHGRVKPDENEVSAIQWISLGRLKENLKNKPEEYTPWLRLLIEKYSRKLGKLGDPEKSDKSEILIRRSRTD